MPRLGRHPAMALLSMSEPPCPTMPEDAPIVADARVRTSPSSASSRSTTSGRRSGRRRRPATSAPAKQSQTPSPPPPVGRQGEGRQEATQWTRAQLVDVAVLDGDRLGRGLIRVVDQALHVVDGEHAVAEHFGYGPPVTSALTSAEQQVVGVPVYGLHTGRLPFGGDRRQQLGRRPEPKGIGVRSTVSRSSPGCRCGGPAGRGSWPRSCRTRGPTEGDPRPGRRGRDHRLRPAASPGQRSPPWWCSRSRTDRSTVTSRTPSALPVAPLHVPWADMIVADTPASPATAPGSPGARRRARLGRVIVDGGERLGREGVGRRTCAGPRRGWWGGWVAGRFRWGCRVGSGCPDRTTGDSERTAATKRI